MKITTLQIFLTTTEQKSFVDVANITGVSPFPLIRELLRLTARQELEDAGLSVAFLILVTFE